MGLPSDGSLDLFAALLLLVIGCEQHRIHIYGGGSSRGGLPAIILASTTATFLPLHSIVHNFPTRVLLVLMPVVPVVSNIQKGPSIAGMAVSSSRLMNAEATISLALLLLFVLAADRLLDADIMDPPRSPLPMH